MTPLDAETRERLGREVYDARCTDLETSVAVVVVALVLAFGLSLGFARRDSAQAPERVAPSEAAP